jgi:hypothetical protein
MAGWFACCDDPHGVTGSWMGAVRDTEEKAQADADDHKVTFPNHKPSVLYDNSAEEGR